MDQETPINTIEFSSSKPAQRQSAQGLLHPAYLFVGNEQELLEHSISLLQKTFCNNSGCSVCIICRKIQEQQHESVQWLMPEKQYAIEDLKVIFSTIAFALEHDEHYYFVIQKADHLTTSCANALLKSLEEPPAGYHFILLAQRMEHILPTIKSRCLMQAIGMGNAISAHTALMPFFTTTAFQDPLAFAKELEAANPNEWDSLTLLDELLGYWAAQYKKQIIAHNNKGQEQSQRMMQHLKKAMLQPPMPGSSKLFWKNLFLQIKEL
jgi:DNA polymerase III, delta subunit